MTKEKFDRLCDQMCETPITSYKTLCKMIYIVYDKAIFEPTFGEIYAELCLRLSDKTKQNPFVKIVESDEEPIKCGEGYINFIKKDHTRVVEKFYDA